MLLEILVCILIADYITGIIHWWEDTYGLPTWPIIGKLVIEPNIEHHRNPGLIGSMTGLVDRNIQSLLGAALVFAIAYYFELMNWQLIVTGIVAGFGNEVHTWSHRGGNKLVRLLQDMAILQTPQHHAKHHRGDHDQCYCTITNWLNPILDRSHHWRAIEWAITKLGITVKRGSKERNGY